MLATSDKALLQRIIDFKKALEMKVLEKSISPAATPPTYSPATE